MRKCYKKPFLFSLMLKKCTTEKPFEKDKLPAHEIRCLNLQTRAQKSQQVIIIIKKLVHMEQPMVHLRSVLFLLESIRSVLFLIRLILPAGGLASGTLSCTSSVQVK